MNLLKLGSLYISLFSVLTIQAMSESVSIQDVYSSILKLKPINVIESKEDQFTRRKNEDLLQDMLNNVDEHELFSLSFNGKRLNDYLSKKGYKIINKELVNRYLAHRKRYTNIFRTFLQNTNEKQKAQNIISSLFKNISKDYSNYFKNGMKVFDIGCGDGKFSSSIATDLSKILPNGIADIKFSGIDSQLGFVNSTNEALGEIGITNPNIKLGNFRDDELSKDFFDSSNFILASHICYVFPSMSLFIERIEKIAKENAITVFLHSSDSPMDNYRQNYCKILRYIVKGNTLEKIEKSLDSADLKYFVLDFHPEVKFPVLTDDEWQQLNQVKRCDFDKDYSNFSDNFREAKNLIEFFLVDPLEAFNVEERVELLNSFKKLLDNYNNLIPLGNRMHISISQNSDKDLVNAIESSLKNIAK